MLDRLYDQWHRAIMEGFANPSPTQARLLQDINRRIAEYEAIEAAQQAALRRVIAERVQTIKARIKALEQVRAR